MAIEYPLWECILCCCMCIGLLVLFRKTLDVQGKPGKFPFGKPARSLRTTSRAHRPALRLAILGVRVFPLAKFALATAGEVPLVCLWSHLTRGLGS
jgi:hypothetical protein